MIKINKLEDLIKSGTISSYSILTLDQDGKICSEPGSGSRETQELVLNFPSGQKLVIGTFCSGCNENTILCID